MNVQTDPSDEVV